MRSQSECLEVPLSELTLEELGQMRVHYAEKLKSLPKRFADLDVSDEAWARCMEKVRKEDVLLECASFVSDQQVMARTTMRLLEDRDCTGVDEIIGYLASEGLSQNPMAVVMAQQVYWKFIEGRCADDPVATYLEYCRILSKAFQKAGIEV